MPIGFGDNVRNQHHGLGYDEYSLSNPYWFIGRTHPPTALNSPLSSLAPSLAQFYKANVVYVKVNQMNIPKGLNTGKL